MAKINFTTPQGEQLYFQGADIHAKYDLLNWQNTGEGPAKFVLIGRVDGFDLHLNESAIQWTTGSNQVAKIGELKKILWVIIRCIHENRIFLFFLLFRSLFQCAVKDAHQVHGWHPEKVNLFAVLTVFHVLMGRLAIKLVRKI